MLYEHTIGYKLVPELRHVNLSCCSSMGGKQMQNTLATVSLECCVFVIYISCTICSFWSCAAKKEKEMLLFHFTHKRTCSTIRTHHEMLSEGILSDNNIERAQPLGSEVYRCSSPRSPLLPMPVALETNNDYND